MWSPEILSIAEGNSAEWLSCEVVEDQGAGRGTSNAREHAGIQDFVRLRTLRSKIRSAFAGRFQTLLTMDVRAVPNVVIAACGTTHRLRCSFADS